MGISAFRPGRPRRRPYPNDMIFSGVPVMLGHASPQEAQGGSGTLVATRPQTLDKAAPPAYGYDAQNPMIERVQPYDDMSLGFGLKVQDQFKDNRYYYTIGADLSCGVWQKGPLITSYTPGTVDSTNGIGGFFEIGGNLYAQNGRYVQKRVNDSSWTVSVDFGSGKACVDAVHFYSNGSTEFVYVAMGDSEKMYKFDGTTWTQHGSLYARCFCVLSNEFYRGSGNNQLAKVDPDADPWTAANWTADNAFNIGDKTQPIVRLIRTPSGGMLVMKPDGIYTLDSSGNSINLFPHTNFVLGSLNGQVNAVWLGNIFTTYSQSTYRLMTDNVYLGTLKMEEIGPERLMSNDSDIHGQITAMAPHGGFHLYAGIYNPDSGNSYLMKFGGYTGGNSGQSPDVKRIDAWHGSISSAFAGKKITSLKESTIGAPSGHSRMYIGFSDGSIAYFTLPCAPNPASCSSYSYTTDDATIRLPSWHAGFGNDSKTLRAITIASTVLSSTNYAQLQYKETSLSIWNTFSTNFTTSPRQYQEFSIGVFAAYMDFQIILKSSSSSSCPVILSMGVHHTVRPPLFLVYEMLVLAEDGLIKRDGRPYQLGASRIRDLVQSSAGSPGMTTIILPDESTKTVSVIDYEETDAWDDRFRKMRSAIKIRCAQQINSVVFGTVGRLSPYIIQDLSGYTVSQLAGI